MSTIGERIFFLRKLKGMTQTEFADKLGITATHICCIEKGTENMSFPLVKLTSYVYQVNEGWLLTGEGNMYSSGHEEMPPKTRVEIKTINNSIFTELYIDGHRVDGVRGFKLEQVSGAPPKLILDLRYIDLAIDQQCIMYSKSPGNKIEKIIWAEESEEPDSES